ncbi:MAG: dockerin type I domain-containing protein [Patescibacteria group bacterium]
MDGRKLEKTKIVFFVILVLEIVFLVVAFSGSVFAQEIDITVSAEVKTHLHCGDGACNFGETCSTCRSDCGGCGGGGGGGGGGEIIIPSETKVVFIGRAYPSAIITILKNGTVIASFSADNVGLFNREISGIAADTYNFSVFAEDTEGRRSVTIGFTVGILESRVTTISGIFISPTIDLGPTQVEKGDPVDIYGQSFPESKITIFISSNEIVKDTSATKAGKWSYRLDTTPLEESEHSARAQALNGAGELSAFSQTMSFLVVKKGAMVCRGADLNFDDKINLTDFSILLYYWRQRKPLNICADINHDGIVDLTDFSIMMYYWTK